MTADSKGQTRVYMNRHEIEDRAWKIELENRNWGKFWSLDINLGWTWVHFGVA